MCLDSRLPRINRWKDKQSSTLETVCAAKSSSGDNSVSFGEGAEGAAVTRVLGVCMGVPCAGAGEEASSFHGTGASDAVMPLRGTDFRR